MTFAFHYAARSDVGLVRSNNEDSGYAGPAPARLADGMGGHAGGDVASSMVIGALVAARRRGARRARRQLGPARRASAAANTEIGDQARRTTRPATAWAPRSSPCSAPATSWPWPTSATRAPTCCATASSPRSPRTTRSSSTSSTRAGSPRRRPQHHPQRSLVTRVLTGGARRRARPRRARGAARRPLPALLRRPLRLRRPDTIDEILTSRPTRGETADRLIELALRAGAPDNVTVVVADVVDVDRGQPPPSRRSSAPPRSRQPRHPRRSPRPRPPRPPRSPAQATAGRRTTTASPSPRRGPRSRRGTALRWSRLALVLVVVLAGGVVRRVRWAQRQYYVAAQDGVRRDLPRGRRRTSARSRCPGTELGHDDRRRRPPASYQDSLRQGIEVDDRAATDARVERAARLQATPAGGPRPTARPAARCRRPWRPDAHPDPHPDVAASPTPSTSRRPERHPRPTPSPAPGRAHGAARLPSRRSGPGPHERRVVVHPAPRPQRRAGLLVVGAVRSCGWPSSTSSSPPRAGSPRTLDLGGGYLGARRRLPRRAALRASYADPLVLPDRRAAQRARPGHDPPGRPRPDRAGRLGRRRPGGAAPASMLDRDRHRLSRRRARPACPTTARSRATATPPGSSASCCCCCPLLPVLALGGQRRPDLDPHRAALVPARRVREDPVRRLLRGVPRREARRCPVAGASVPRHDAAPVPRPRAPAGGVGRRVAVLVFESDLGTSLMFFGIVLVMLYVATERISG